MVKADTKSPENHSHGILKIFKYISPLAILYAYYAIGMYIWISTLKSSSYYISDVFPSLLNITSHINLWTNFLEISLYYTLSLLIPFWIQFVIILTIYNKLPNLNLGYVLEILSGMFTFFAWIFILVILKEIFKDTQEGSSLIHLGSVIIFIILASILAFNIQATEYKPYNLKVLFSDKKLLHFIIITSLVVTAFISLFLPIYDYNKGYGLSCDALSSARNYSKDGEEYIFSNRQNIDDQDIGNITPNMLEHKESSNNSKWEQDKYNEFRYSRWAVSEKILSSPVNKDNPISIKFLNLKDEGDDIRILITDVRKIYESNSHNPKVNNINLLSNPVVITVPKNDLLGRGDGGNGVEKFCVKDRYN